MLTPTDVHLLVGLLTQISRPNGVDIVLGDMIFDSVAEEDRDVDITVRAKSNTGTTIFEGIEVKHHRRPLDATHVEQLCAKLNDMPEFTERGIVSASGYTKPAIRKASHNKVALYELRDWPKPMRLGNITLSDKLQIGDRKYEWIGTPHVTIITSINKPMGEDLQFEMSAPIVDSTGVQNAVTPTCDALARKLISRATILAEQQGKSLGMTVGEIKPVTFNITLEDQLSTIVEGRQIPLAKAVISGTIKYIETEYAPKYTGLYKLGEQQPFIACAIFEMQNRSLGGFVVDPNHTLRFLNISVGSRLLKKIYRKPLS